MNKLTAAGKGLTNFLHQQPLNSSTEIRLTRLCTQRCRQCSVYERTTEPASISLENFKIIARRLREYGAFIGFISGGEATMVPYLDEILIEARKTFPLAQTLVTGLYNKTDIIKRFGSVALDNGQNIQTSLDGFGELGDELRGAKNFSTTVLKHMKLLSQIRGNRKSLLYANIVINNLNLEQVPELIRRARDIGWKTTIGVYHSLTETTRFDRDLKLQPGDRLDNLIDFLTDNPDILNLNSFITGINSFVKTEKSDICAFTDSPILTTRLTIMEDGNVHLCWGDPIGNLLEQDLKSIFSSPEYQKRLAQYRTCQGCWTTCYTQRHLLVHPRNARELWQNTKGVLGLKPKPKTYPTWVQ